MEARKLKKKRAPRQEKKSYVRVNIEIERELLARFDEIFPQYGARKWFLNAFFEKFLERYDFKPDEVMKEALEEVISSLGDR